MTIKHGNSGGRRMQGFKETCSSMIDGSRARLAPPARGVSLHASMQAKASPHLIALQLAVFQVDVTFASGGVDVDLGVHGQVDDPASVCRRLVTTHEGGQLVALAVDVKLVGGLETPGAVWLRHDGPGGVG